MIRMNCHGERRGRVAVTGLILAAFAFFAPASFAQQNSDIDAVKKRAELNSAKADLEEARKKRDMAVAARWKDRETANQEREMFNDKYQESKEKVDALMSERARLFEDVRVAREDLAQVKLQAEKARAEFLSLAAGPERLETLSKFQEQGVQFKVAERVEIQNKVKKEMSLYRDDPLRIRRFPWRRRSPWRLAPWRPFRDADGERRRYQRVASGCLDAPCRGRKETRL